MVDKVHLWSVGNFEITLFDNCRVCRFIQLYDLNLSLIQLSNGEFVMS
jgi:hypothetical protein